eukprot:1820757-Pyramimonas_sp.AAC.1
MLSKILDRSVCGLLATKVPNVLALCRGPSLCAPYLAPMATPLHRAERSATWLNSPTTKMGSPICSA